MVFAFGGNALIMSAFYIVEATSAARLFGGSPGWFVIWGWQLVNWHFWLATIGIVLYAASMWVSGIMEGLMWREVDANGFLVNAFADTVAAKFPMYVVRALGGGLFFTGGLIMCWNLWMTLRAQPAKATQHAAVPAE